MEPIPQTEIRRFFTQTRKHPYSAWVCCLFGMILLLIGLAADADGGTAAFGALLLGAAVFLFLRFSPIITEETLDRCCKTMSEVFFRECRERCMAAGEPIIQSLHEEGYLFENLFTARQSRRCRDDRMRSSIYRAVCLIVTADRTAHFFQNSFSLISSEAVAERKSCPLEQLDCMIQEFPNGRTICITVPGGFKIRISDMNPSELVGLYAMLPLKQHEVEMP